MDLKGRISEIFNLGASQAGKLKNGKGSVDDKKDVQYIDNAIKALKAEADAEARERGVVDLQSLSQTEAEIDAMVNLEMQEMLGASFAKGLGIEKKTDIQKGAAFSDNEISLENLMSLLDDDVDRTKVAEHNEKGSIFSKIINAGIEDNFAQATLEGDSNPEKLTTHISNPVSNQFNHVGSNGKEFGDLANIANMILALRAEGYLT